MELGGKVDENKASSNGAVSYYTIYFVIDETLTIIQGDILKLEIHFMSLIIMMNCGINL